MHNEWLVNVVAAAGKPYCEPSDIGFDLNPVKAVKKVGRTIGRAARKVSRTTRKTLERIPAVGPTLSAAWSLGMVGGALTVADMAGRVAEGERIDKVAYNAFKQRVKDVKTVLPLATAIIGMPGLGVGAEGVVAAGNAVSKAMPLGKPALDALRSELGKSPAALQAFDTTCQIFEGSPVVHPNDLIGKAVAITKSTLEGKSGAALDSAIATLSADQKKGVKSALTFMVAKSVQASTRKNTTHALPAFFKAGVSATGKDSVLKLAQQELRHKPEVQKGFTTAVGLLTHKANPTAVIAARDALTPEQRKGFDIGASIRIGQLASPLPDSVKPREKLGYYLTKGSEGLKPEARKQILSSVNDPTMRKGVRIALAEKPSNIIEKIIEFFFGKKAA